MGTTTLTFSAAELAASCAADARCVIDAEGARLADGFLSLLDRGRVQHNRNEELSRYVWARQRITLPLTAPSGGSVALLLYEYHDNTRPLRLLVNGRPLQITPEPRLQGAYAWRVVELPAGTLQPGLNELVAYADNLAFDAWALAVDTGAAGGGSAKSWDAGGQWSAERLGLDFSLRGEYMVRWWAASAPPEGTLTAPPFAVGSGAISASYDGEGPIVIEARRGPTAEPGEGWSDWAELPLPPGGEYVQWRATLRRSDGELPLLRGVTLTANGETVGCSRRPLAAAAEPRFRIVYERADHPELRDLWAEEGLQAVVAGLESDLARAAALCSWVNAQWIHNNSYDIYTPWRAATILNWQRARRGHGSSSVTGFCVHFGVALAQLCTAAGMAARGVVLGQRSSQGMDGHFVCEVFCRELQKWVMFDPDFDYHFTHRDVPLSVAEIGQLWRAGAAAELRLVVGASFGRNPAGPEWPMAHVTQGGYSWFGLPLRQDWLSRPDLQPVSHGALNYHEAEIVWCSAEPEHRRIFPLVTADLRDLYAPPQR